MDLSMGRQSSAKKVARAARAGSGGGTGRTRKLGFPAAIAAVLLIGLGLVVFAKVQQSSSDVDPQIGEDHWHSAIAVWTCDQFLATPLTDTQNDALGIHTHDDGLIHIHPKSSNAAGENATLGVFADEVGIEFGEDSFTLPAGTTYTTGDDCQGEAGTVEVLKWTNENLDGEPEVITSDFADTRFTGNGEAFTVAFVKPGQDLKALLPPSLEGINQPSDLAPGETIAPVELPEGLGATTVPGTEPGGAGETAPPTTAAPGTTPPGAPDTTAGP
jgi:hypothetical protein